MYEHTRLKLNAQNTSEMLKIHTGDKTHFIYTIIAWSWNCITFTYKNVLQTREIDCIVLSIHVRVEIYESRYEKGKQRLSLVGSYIYQASHEEEPLYFISPSTNCLDSKILSECFEACSAGSHGKWVLT